MFVEKSERIEAFVSAVWDWYAVHKRVLPWRDLPHADPTERAYKVLVSEIMLQQTQVSRVIIIFKAFLERFPSITKLAQASNADVIMAWRGMGYNSRALRLRDAARTVVEKGKEGKKGKKVRFPSSMETLMAIPGIGHYTAAAVRNFAFGIPTPCIDTNIRRILHRTLVGPEDAEGGWEKDDRYLLEIAEEVLAVALEKGDTANWHAALMDFGSLVQTKRNPKWDICPLTQKGIMKTTAASWRRNQGPESKNQGGIEVVKKQEPGREIAGKHIPNRIIRGRVVEALRDAPKGMTLGELGRHVCIDWSEEEHKEWMSQLLQKLIRDSMIQEKKKKFVLA